MPKTEENDTAYEQSCMRAFEMMKDAIFWTRAAIQAEAERQREFEAEIAAGKVEAPYLGGGARIEDKDLGPLTAEVFRYLASTGSLHPITDRGQPWKE